MGVGGWGGEGVESAFTVKRYIEMERMIFLFFFKLPCLYSFVYLYQI